MDGHILALSVQVPTCMILYAIPRGNNQVRLLSFLPFTNYSQGIEWGRRDKKANPCGA
jgi:hypothetical protein